VFADPFDYKYMFLLNYSAKYMSNFSMQQVAT
jgi:hypothetical protein